MFCKKLVSWICICNHKNRERDTTWGTYNLGRLVGLDWVCVVATTTRSDSDYIKFVVKSVITSCIRVATIGLKSNHIKSTVTITAISDNKITVIRVENNLSINNYIVVNKGIKRATTDSVYNRESNNASIWSIGRANCRIDRANYCINRSKTTKHLAFLTHFWSRILGCNFEYRWGNVKWILTFGNY